LPKGLQVGADDRKAFRDDDSGNSDQADFEVVIHGFGSPSGGRTFAPSDTDLCRTRRTRKRRAIGRSTKYLEFQFATVGFAGQEIAFDVLQSGQGRNVGRWHVQTIGQGFLIGAVI